jgi:hypothetical protein
VGCVRTDIGRSDSFGSLDAGRRAVPLRSAIVKMWQVFGAFGDLLPADRFQIAVPLRQPFSFVPLAASEFAALPVIADLSDSALFVGRLEAAIERVIDGPLLTRSFGALVPGMSASRSAIETAPGVTNRLVAIVRSHGRRTWADLATTTVGEIRGWHGAGRTMTVRLVMAAVETALQMARTTQLALTYQTVARSEVSAALDACLTSLPDARGRSAFEIDDLQVVSSNDRTPTYELVGLSNVHSNRLKRSAREHVRTAATADATLALALTRLSDHLGDAIDGLGIEHVFAAHGLPRLADPAGLLALWLAGPYLPIPGDDVSGSERWWSPRPSAIAKETSDLLASSGGVHTYDQLLRDLVGIGVSTACAPRWLARQRIRIHDGIVVLVSGRVGDVLTRVFEATGRAMSNAELATWMPTSEMAAAVVAELRRNGAFLETGPGRWELADWGGVPSDHFVHIDVAVSPDVLSGSEGDVPIEVAALLGLRPGTPLNLSTRFGPLAMSYDGVRVVRGSARPVVLASGAAIGDVLSFVVDPRTNAVQITVTRSKPTGDNT